MREATLSIRRCRHSRALFHVYPYIDDRCQAKVVIQRPPIISAPHKHNGACPIGASLLRRSKHPPIKSATRGREQAHGLPCYTRGLAAACRSWVRSVRSAPLAGRRAYPADDAGRASSVALTQLQRANAIGSARPVPAPGVVAAHPAVAVAQPAAFAVRWRRLRRSRRPPSGAIDNPSASRRGTRRGRGVLSQVGP